MCQSVSAILGLRERELKQWLLRHTYPIAISPEAWGHLPRRDRLKVTSSWRSTYYFHFTRTLTPRRYKQIGLMPLNDALFDVIWTDLLPLTQTHMTTQEWQEFREELEADARVNPDSPYAE